MSGRKSSPALRASGLDGGGGYIPPLNPTPLNAATGQMSNGEQLSHLPQVSLRGGGQTVLLSAEPLLQPQSAYF